MHSTGTVDSNLSLSHESFYSRRKFNHRQQVRYSNNLRLCLNSQ